MAKPRKTARKTARKPTRKASRKPREVKLAPEKLEKLYGEFTAQGIASVEIPTAPEGLLKVQRS